MNLIPNGMINPEISRRLSQYITTQFAIGNYIPLACIIGITCCAIIGFIVVMVKSNKEKK